MLFRHGDVILKKVNKIPEGAKKQANKVLAYGEVTGHSHRFEAPNVTVFKFEDTLYAQVTDSLAALVHEEHAKIDVPPGIYEIGIQREYEPDGWRQVAD